jgi:hypothetical protein
LLKYELIILKKGEKFKVFDIKKIGLETFPEELRNQVERLSWDKMKKAIDLILFFTKKNSSSYPGEALYGGR